MKKDVQEKIEKLQEKAEKVWSEYWAIKSEITELQINSFVNIDAYTGKFVKYVDTFNDTHYMRVSTIMIDKMNYNNFDFSYLFRGLGFSGEFTGYDDETSFDWSYWYEFYVYGNTDKIEEIFGNLVEITEEEFNSKFDKYIEKMKEFHKKGCK